MIPLEITPGPCKSGASRIWGISNRWEWLQRGAALQAVLSHARHMGLDRAWALRVTLRAAILTGENTVVALMNEFPPMGFKALELIPAMMDVSVELAGVPELPRPGLPLRDMAYRAYLDGFNLTEIANAVSSTPFATQREKWLAIKHAILALPNNPNITGNGYFQTLAGIVSSDGVSDTYQSLLTVGALSTTWSALDVATQLCLDGVGYKGALLLMVAAGMNAWSTAGAVKDIYAGRIIVDILLAQLPGIDAYELEQFLGRIIFTVVEAQF